MPGADRVPGHGGPKGGRPPSTPVLCTFSEGRLSSRKQLLSLIFIVLNSFLIAQVTHERFPVFEQSNGAVQPAAATAHPVRDRFSPRAVEVCSFPLQLKIHVRPCRFGFRFRNLSGVAAPVCKACVLVWQCALGVLPRRGTGEGRSHARLDGATAGGGWRARRPFRGPRALFH